MNPQKSPKAAVHVSFSDYTNSEKLSAKSTCGVTDDVIDATSRLSANTNTTRDDKRCSANASNITLDADGKPMFRPKSPAMGRASGAGKVLTRKSTPANLPKVGKILGKWMKLCHAHAQRTFHFTTKQITNVRTPCVRTYVKQLPVQH